jgi:hypothetical protein
LRQKRVGRNKRIRIAPAALQHCADLLLQQLPGSGAIKRLRPTRYGPYRREGWEHVMPQISLLPSPLLRMALANHVLPNQGARKNA